MYYWVISVNIHTFTTEEIGSYPPPPPPPPSNVLIHLHYPVNCNNTGMLTADKHAHTCPKPRWHFSRGSASKKLTFRGLGRVLRSGKFSQKFVFERKSARKSTFLSKSFNFKDSNLVSWIVLSSLHPLTAKTSWVTA